MLSSVSKIIKDPSVLRRLLFAVSQLPNDLPNYWNIAVQFATCGNQSYLTPDQAKVLVENLHELDAKAFDTDRELLQQLMELQVSASKPPIGLILISSNKECLLCGSQLQLRKDRCAPLIVYDDIIGTIPASHFHKYCTNRGCGLTQYYGYHTIDSSVYFDSNWDQLPFFISSRESAFSLSLMKRFNAEVVVGQLSFKQCAEVYNYTHNYPDHNTSTPLIQ